MWEEQFSKGLENVLLNAERKQEATATLSRPKETSLELFALGKQFMMHTLACRIVNVSELVTYLSPYNLRPALRLHKNMFRYVDVYSQTLENKSSDPPNPPPAGFGAGAEVVVVAVGVCPG